MFHIVESVMGQVVNADAVTLRVDYLVQSGEQANLVYIAADDLKY